MAIGLAPKYEREYPLGDKTPAQMLALAFKTAEELEWRVGTITPSGFLAYKGLSLSTYGDELRFRIAEPHIYIRSATMGEQIMDWGKNESNVKEFLEKLVENENLYSSEELEEQYEILHTAMVDESGEALADAPATNLSRITGFLDIFIPRKGFFFTPLLIDINILVFIVMVISGVGIMEPQIPDLIKWGASYRPLTMDGQPWRLISNTFLHIGILHLLMNMYALLYIGVLLESILGKSKFIAAYFLTGIVASVCSVAIHENTVSAGASGAIFGLYGVFLALLTTNFIEKQARKTLLTSIGLFILFNLFSGLKEGVDNAAHIGGLISGLLIGYAFVPGLKNPENKLFSTYALPILSVVILGIVGTYYFTYPKDFKLVEKHMGEFVKYENEALELYKMGDSINAQRVPGFILSVGIPDWEKCRKNIEEMNKLNISKEQRKRNKLLTLYCNLRIQSYGLIYKAYTENSDAYRPAIDSMNREIESVINQITRSQKR